VLEIVYAMKGKNQEKPKVNTANPFIVQRENQENIAISDQ
jgi:hypothetical protein